MTTKRYGWRADAPDLRDQMMQLQAPMLLPQIVDLRPKCTPVLDQGQLGSCVSHATRAAIDFEVKQRGLPLLAPSRLFIYYLAREIEGSLNDDAGCEIRDAMKSVGKYGVAPETMWPYLIDKFAATPPSLCYKTATNHLVQRYYSVAQDLTQMKSCLAAGYPFVFGFTVYNSFESQAVTNTGIVPMPSTLESRLGGHAVLAVGFNDSTRRFYVQNSWGTAWGQKGFFEIPYDYLLNPNLASDFWTIRLVEDIGVNTTQDAAAAPDELIAVKTIKQEVDEIDRNVSSLSTAVETLSAHVDCQLSDIDKSFFTLLRDNRIILTAIKAIVDLVNHNLSLTRQIFDLLTDPEAAVALKINISQGVKMSQQKDMHLKLVVFENGQATGSLVPVGPSGNPAPMPVGETIPVWTASDPSIIVSASADGLTALLTAGAVEVIGATVTATASSADGTSTLTGTSDPFNIVAAPEVATGFKITVQ